MLKAVNTKVLTFQAAFVTGLLTASSADAANNFSNIAENITGSIEELPGLVTALSYMIGLLMGVLGVMKIKDHVENPTQTPMKDGAIRLAAGGALFALPILFESMLNTIGTTGVNVGPAVLNKATFNTL